MNVYDFDGTIYKKDSSIELYKFIVRKYPFILIICLPRQILGIAEYKIKKISKECMKEKFFSFLKYVDTEKILDDFVDKEMKNINLWYKKQHKPNDVIISASPYFLIKKFAQKLKVENVIASQVEIKTGKFYSKNCHGEEKVKRFREKFPNDIIDKFYSDSLSDFPMANVANISYKVKGEKIELWEKSK